MRVPNPLVIEVLADGGIRLTTLAGETELASLPATLDWVAEANRRGVHVHLRGELTEPVAVPVVEQVRRIASSLHEAPSEPAPWPKRRSSMQTAAANGSTEQVADLLDRGCSPNVGGRRWTPYHLAMQRGHTDVLVALRDAGVRLPRGLMPPAVLPDAVVLRAYPPDWMWWLLLVPFGALAVGAMVDGAYAAVPIFLILPLLGIGTVCLLLSNTRCAVDGPYVARRRGRRWQGPVDLRTLHALGHTPPGTVRMPLLWVLGQREAGERPNVYSKSAFDKQQRMAMAEIAGLRFLPLYAAGGFMSPGFERLVARHLDPTNVIVGQLAADRIWPGRRIAARDPVRPAEGG